MILVTIIIIMVSKIVVKTKSKSTLNTYRVIRMYFELLMMRRG